MPSSVLGAALLVTFRFVQGFALGGEWGGAVLMSVEHAPQGRRGFFGSFVALGLPAGIILSNLCSSITSNLVSPEQFAAWGMAHSVHRQRRARRRRLVRSLGHRREPDLCGGAASAHSRGECQSSTCCGTDARTVLLAAGQLRRNQRARIHPASSTSCRTPHASSVSH